MIARNPEERRLYDARLKNQRDQAAILEQAVADAAAEAWSEGRAEGEMIGKIQLLEELLGLRLSNKNELAEQGKSALATRMEELQRQLQKRRGKD